MRVFRLLGLCLVPLLVQADQSRRFLSGPFEVLSLAGEKPAREVLVELEQVRHMLGLVIGQQDLEAVWPMRVVVFDSARDAQGSVTGRWFRKRDLWILGTVKGQPLPHGQFVQILLEANTQRMPEDVEQGLVELFSTIRVDGVRIALGAPVAKPDFAWARMHLLAVNPKYSGRVQVLFGNLQQDADWHAAYKNAFGKTPDEMRSEVAAYLAGGNLPVRELSGAPISERSFNARDFEPAHAETTRADVLEGDAARAAYQSVVDQNGAYAPALEGLGKYDEAIEAGSRSAACYVEFGRRLAEPARARQAYARAAQLNPRWAEPWALMASIDTNLPLKIQDLKRATELDTRDLEYWEALANAYIEAKQPTLAAQAWGGAMRASRTEEERERYYQERLRLAEAQAEKKVLSAQTEAIQRRRTEDRRMREEWEEMIRRTQQPSDPQNPEGGSEVVEWWDDPRPKEKVWGVLKQVDCIGSAARLLVEDSEGQVNRLLVKDPGKTVIMGGGQTALGCGVQNPAKPVAVEYFKEADAGLKTAGEVVLIEFR